MHLTDFPGERLTHRLPGHPLSFWLRDSGGEPDENLDWPRVLGDAVAADLEITFWELLL